MSDLADKVAQINREIIALWKARFTAANPAVRWPMISPLPTQNGLTVIGCNPALPESNYYSVPRFSKEEATNQLLNGLAALEIRARKSYPYYTPFHRLATELNLPFEHVDLFFYRETSQALLLQLVSKTDGTLNDFGQRQVELAIQLLALCSPKIILVSNAFAARVFKKQFRLSKLDAEGLYWVTLDGRRIPVFLSGMLSGRRCLDSHSYERLVWHMGHALKATRAGPESRITHADKNL